MKYIIRRTSGKPLKLENVKEREFITILLYVRVLLKRNQRILNGSLIVAETLLRCLMKRFVEFRRKQLMSTLLI